MAATITVKDDYGTYFYINSASRKEVLTQVQRDTNAWYIFTYCRAAHPDWTVEAISAMCGNFAHEGVMNPSQWEYGYGMSLSKGFGLGQWTPATKLIDWVTAEGYERYQISGQMERIHYESQHKGTQWIATSSYNLSMEEFLQSTQAPSYLASAWLYDWERPGDPAATEQLRKDDADYYFTLFSGEEPPDPGPDPEPPGPSPSSGKSGLKPCYYHRFKYD